MLTAAHVVGNNPTVQCEFWHNGHQSSPLPGRVVNRSEAADAAIVAVPEASLGGILPAVIPLAGRQSEIRPGDTLVSVGCANGGWSTSWKGHTLGCEDGQLRFLPTPANGRSGSAIFDAQGEHIVALLRARTGNDSEGIAVPVSAIYQVFDVAASSTAAPALAQCGPEGCPSGGCCPNGSCPLPQPWQNHLLPYRARHDAPNSVPQPGSGNSGPWPSVPAVDLSRLDEKLGRITTLLEDLKRNEESGSGAATQHSAGGTPPPAPLGEPAKPLVDEQARKMAEAALGQVGDLRTEAEKGLRDVKTDAAKTNEAVEKIKDSIEENGTISQRFHARVDKVKTELEDKLGHEASDREVRIAYMKDLIQDKLGDGGALRSLKGYNRGIGRRPCHRAGGLRRTLRGPRHACPGTMPRRPIGGGNDSGDAAGFRNSGSPYAWNDRDRGNPQGAPRRLSEQDHDPFHQPGRQTRNRSVACRSGCLPAERWSRASLAGSDQLCSRRRAIRVSAAEGAGLFTKPEAAMADDPLASLSPREMEVFSYLVKGMRAKDIAELLHISPKTVDTYRATLMRKLNVHDIVGLVKFAIERNLTRTSG